MERFDSAARVMSGTHGKLWLSGERVAEVTALQAKITKNKKELARCGHMMSDHKVMGVSGKGSVTLFHVDSGMLLREEGIKSGLDNRYTLISELNDPDAMGAERVALYGVSFDEMTLADWKAAAEGSITVPFTFNDYELLDAVQPQ